MKFQHKMQSGQWPVVDPETRSRSGGKKHEICMTAFGSRVFLDLFTGSQGLAVP